MKRLRQLFESIVYAGMKPGAAPSDPFYLSNRTLGQKIRIGALVALPCLLVLAGVALGLGYFDRSARMPPPAKPLTNAEIAARMLPDLTKDLNLETNKDLEVVEVRVHHAGGNRITGAVKNNTNRVLTEAEVILDLTDSGGSHLGAVSCKIARVEPKGRAPFQSPIDQSNAVFALVREVHSR